MPRFTSPARAVCGVAFALALASACGGHSASNGADPGDAAGATSHAGSSSGAGKSQAGSSNSAGSGGGDDACSGPSQLGTCSAAFQRWTHDSTIGLCVPVGYGGCGATKNNYETLEACQQACRGRGAGFDACKAPTDCMLVPPGCCGVCDGPSISKHDFLAYNKLYEGTVSTCGNGNVACGACPIAEPSIATLKFFVPNCVNGECVVEDIRESDVTACTTSEDCQLRAGTGCCESCDPGDVVAIRNDGTLDKLVCGDVIPPCLPCEPALNTGAVALCRNGHCAMAFVK